MFPFLSMQLYTMALTHFGAHEKYQTTPTTLLPFLSMQPYCILWLLHTLELMKSTKQHRRHCCLFSLCSKTTISTNYYLHFLHYNLLLGRLDNGHYQVDMLSLVGYVVLLANAPIFALQNSKIILHHISSLLNIFEYLWQFTSHSIPT